jgi:hypothetical protein
MSTFHPEANPSLNGWDLYLRDPLLMDKQIQRLLGKSITLAANAYRHRIGRYQLFRPSSIAQFSRITPQFPGAYIGTTICRRANWATWRTFCTCSIG